MEVASQTAESDAAEAPSSGIESPEVAAGQAPVEVQPEPIVYPVAPFQGDALYQLLVAEIAGFRSRYDVALEQYMQATEETRDAGVAERATRLALYLKKEDAALRTALIWAEKDSGNIDAHRHAADLLLRSGRLEEAIDHMEAVKNLGGLAKFDVFAFRSANLSPEARSSLLKVVSEMLDRHPEDRELMFSKAVLLDQSGELEQALNLIDRLILVSDNINVVVLKLGVLTKLERSDDALVFLQAKVEALPDNTRLRLILARLVFERGDLESAKQQYGMALQSSPNDGDVLFALALIALQQRDDELAKRYFERMVRWDRRPGEAQYYLGGIAERQSDTVSALRAYEQVGDGYEFVPAQARIATILVNDGRWEEAREHLSRMRTRRPARERQLIMIEAQLLEDRGMEEEAFVFLDQVLLERPRDVEFLYFRAMTGQRFDRLDILERDLRRVIEVEPENADALNALGYTLTDQTDRHEEALELIARALALKPDEAAFIDSMGWVQYRLKNYEEAVVHLRRALTLFQNDEVAAHLGEVLWVMGDRQEANRVWEEALKIAPESNILQDVIKKFRVE